MAVLCSSSISNAEMISGADIGYSCLVDDGSISWVPATHVGGPDWFLDSRLWPVLTLAVASIWESE